MHDTQIGKPAKRVRVEEKLTGRLQYISDKPMDGVLHAALLRSPIASGEIAEINTQKALALPGVVEVATYKDFPAGVPKFGSVVADQPLIADGVVRYEGEPVAAIVATDARTAKEARGLVEITYKETPPVLTVADALAREKDGENPFLYTVMTYNWGEEKPVPHLELKNHYHYPMVYHFPIERFACMARPDEDGVEVLSPIQHPFILRRVVATCLGLPMSKVRVAAQEIGGGFGGKGYPKIEPLAAYLALKNQRAVYIETDAKESFHSSRRHAAEFTLTTGFDETGRITSQIIEGNCLMGAYADASPRVVGKSSYLCCGPYKIPYMRSTTNALLSNTVPSTAFRGFGMPQLLFAVEQQLNRAAIKLGLDGLEIRLRNLPDKGDMFRPGDAPCGGDWKGALQKAADLVNWNAPTPENEGKSVAIGIKSGIHGSTARALVRINSDGSINLMCGTTEMGQGSRTVLSQIAADKLQVDTSGIHAVLGDTLYAPFDFSTAGSRSTVSMGTAVENACDDALSQLCQLAAKVYKADEADICQAPGGLEVAGTFRSYSDIIQGWFGIDQGDVLGQGTFIGIKKEGHPLGGHADFWEFVVMGCRLRVVPETGEIIPLDVSVVSDIGKVINPVLAQGQDEGGFLMGLGQALCEEMRYSDKGVLMNANALDYKVLSIKDIPEKFSHYFLENQDGPGPGGAKGLGEGSAIPVGPLIAGGVMDATGLVAETLPITRERLYFMLQDKKQQEEKAWDKK